MVRAGILTPEHVPTTVYVTSTDADLVTALTAAADLRTQQAEGRAAAAKLLAAKGLLGGDAGLVLNQIGYARWAVDPPAPAEGQQAARAATAHLTLMLGPCPYSWFGCPARQEDGESIFETGLRWPKSRAPSTPEAKLVQDILELPVDADFTTLPFYDLGLYLYIDKASELLSAGIDAIGGTTRGFLGSANLGWLSYSARYLRQIISWSGDDSRWYRLRHLHVF
jgi:hypothetical protein